MLVKLVTLLILATAGAVLPFWQVRVQVRLELYDVQDMVFGGMDMGHPFDDFPDDMLPEGHVGGSQFAARIQNSIRPDQWAQKDCWSIRTQNGLLIVRAPAFVHKEMEAYLLDLRSHPHPRGRFRELAPCGRGTLYPHGIPFATASSLFV
jgi:hypothetical protein